MDGYKFHKYLLMCMDAYNLRVMIMVCMILFKVFNGGCGDGGLEFACA